LSFLFGSETVSFVPKYIPSLWGEREVEFFQKLQNLQALKTFSHREFEKIIDEFQSYVTEVNVFRNFI
jgi:hypothetical protein